MTLDESKQQLVEILTAGADAAGGEWDHKFDRVPVSCSDAYGREGQRYSLVSFGPGSDDPEGTAARAAAVWERMGFEVVTSTLSIGAIEVKYPHDDDGLAFHFWAGENATSLSGVSVCAVEE